MPNENSETGVYVSEAIDYTSFKIGTFNLIVAPCGSGKTEAAFHSIPQHFNIEPKRSIVLVNTVAAAEAFVNEDNGYFFGFNGKEWDSTFLPQYDKPTVMTYAAFGAQIKKKNLTIENYDYIVCDEIHTLNQYIAMARAKLFKQYPYAAPWEINDMLEVTCLVYIALENITKAVETGKQWVFGLTATPAQLYKGHLKTLGSIVNEVRFSQKVRAYDILNKFEYSEIEPILRAVVPENRKRLFFFNSIQELQKYKQILLECGRAAEALWSLTPENGILMNNDQLTTRDYILTEHRFPDYIQDLLINSAYETSINIKDPSVREAYLHTGNEDKRIQARNRLRQDLDVVGYYNSNLRRSKKHDERKQQNQKNRLQARNEEFIKRIPECYIGIRLFSEDKATLINIIEFPKKWPTLKKLLIENGFQVEDGNNHKQRYSVITRP